MIARGSATIPFSWRDVRFELEKEHVVTLPWLAESEPVPPPIGLFPATEGPHPIACVYIDEDGGGLWLHQDWPIGAEARDRLSQLDWQLKGGLVGGMCARADRDVALGNAEAGKYWRRLADYLTNEDLIDKAQYAERYRVQTYRFALGANEASSF